MKKMRKSRVNINIILVFSITFIMVVLSEIYIFHNFSQKGCSPWTMDEIKERWMDFIILGIVTSIPITLWYKNNNKTKK